jgi:P27 family predicted phage terminase small subunit
MRGRKPTPTHLKLLEGNPGKRAINHLEPVPEGDLFDAPEWLSDAQKQGWAYVIANAPAGLLKRLDRSMLTLWVVAEERHRDAAEQVSKHGSIVRARGSNEPVQNPYLAVMNRQAALMVKVASDLGFSPSSRTRIQVGEGAGGGKKQSAFSQFKRS